MGPLEAAGRFFEDFFSQEAGEPVFDAALQHGMRRRLGNALTKTVESRTARSIISAQFLNNPGELLYPR
jgi:hypothetical protein